MRPILIAVALAFALTLSLVAVPVFAQSIYGLSFRTTDAAPEGAPRGSVDIVADDGSYLVTVDLTEAADVLFLDDFDGAEAFVVWAVDMDGVSENIGVLDEDLFLEDAQVDYLIARLYLTAEPSADAESAAGERLYQVTLRNVTEAEEAEVEAQAAAEETPEATAEPEATALPTAQAEAEAKPTVLPTTGSGLGDLIVLAIVSFGLIGAGLRLRTVRL